MEEIKKIIKQYQGKVVEFADAVTIYGKNKIDGTLKEVNVYATQENIVIYVDNIKKYEIPFFNAFLILTLREYGFKRKPYKVGEQQGVFGNKILMEG